MAGLNDFLSHGFMNPHHRPPQQNQHHQQQHQAPPRPTFSRHASKKEKAPKK